MVYILYSEHTYCQSRLCHYFQTPRDLAPVPESVWTYRIGGYQVCEKWLKDRRERRLELDDIRTYCRIVTALQKTIDIQEEIDATLPGDRKRTPVRPFQRIGE